LRLFLSISWLLIVSIAILSPGDSLPEVEVFSFQDKFIHFICFSILSFLWCGVGIKPEEKGVLSKKIKFNFLIFGILAGIILEFLQLFVPFRTFDYLDMAVNEIGGIAGLFAYIKLPVTKNNLE